MTPRQRIAVHMLRTVSKQGVFGNIPLAYCFREKWLKYSSLQFSYRCVHLQQRGGVKRHVSIQRTFLKMNFQLWERFSSISCCYSTGTGVNQNERSLKPHLTLPAHTDDQKLYEMTLAGLASLTVLEYGYRKELHFYTYICIKLFFFEICKFLTHITFSKTF